MIFTRGAIRKIETPRAANTIYLTFDDGPCPVFTPVVLDLLAEYGAKATFFVVAEKAETHPDVISRLVREGHAVGNHSLDHGYRHFFRGTHSLQDWIQAAETKLRTLTGKPTVGFRPPAGVCTPELTRALGNLGMPLILWKVRFFDKTLGWKLRHAQRALARATDGSIILLHDDRREADRPEFLQTLRYFIEHGQKQGFRFAELSSNVLASNALF